MWGGGASLEPEAPSAGQGRRRPCGLAARTTVPCQGDQALEMCSPRPAGLPGFTALAASDRDNVAERECAKEALGGSSEAQSLPTAHCPRAGRAPCRPGPRPPLLAGAPGGRPGKGRDVIPFVTQGSAALVPPGALPSFASPEVLGSGEVVGVASRQGQTRDGMAQQRCRGVGGSPEGRSAITVDLD